MICRPLLGIGLRKKVSMSLGCVSGGKPVTRKVCCFESMVWFAILRTRERANSSEYINARGASYYIALSLAAEVGSRLLDSGVDADFPEDLSARCCIDKAGGSDERMLSSIGWRPRQLKAAHERDGCTRKMPLVAR